MSTRIILDDGDGAPVIDLQVVRDEYQEKAAKLACQHHRVFVDVRKNTLTCRDCKAEVNAVWYLSFIVSEWARFARMKKHYDDASAAYEERSRTKCRHCGKMTDISRNRMRSMP